MKVNYYIITYTLFLAGVVSYLGWSGLSFNHGETGLESQNGLTQPKVSRAHSEVGGAPKNKNRAKNLLCGPGCDHSNHGGLKSPSEGLVVDGGLVDSILANASNGVKLSLPGGEQASGMLMQTKEDDEGVYLVEGRLTEPRPGKFAFSKERVAGVAGPLSGYVVFDEGETAYRVEAFGDENESARLVAGKIKDMMCVGYVTDTEDAQLFTSDHVDIDDPAGVNDDIPILESLRGASAVVYLDFDGEYITEIFWNGPFQAAAFGFSDANMRLIWEEVAEDFAPFNINVTTDKRVFEAAPITSRMQCIFTPTTTPQSGAGGVAWNNSFSSSIIKTCFVFRSNMTQAAMIASHELGHTLGLDHDGKGRAEYFNGHGGTVETSWTPIMGNGTTRNVSQWSKGEYNNATNTQDDLVIIAANNNTGYRDDDYDEGFASGGFLEIQSDDTLRNTGIIGHTGDIDSFGFTLLNTGSLDLQINPNAVAANLDIEASIYDSSGLLLYSSNPEDELAASFTDVTLPAGDYYLSVTGVGAGVVTTAGYSNYASLGYYEIIGTITEAELADRFTVLERSAAGTAVGTVTPRGSHGASSLSFGIQSASHSGAFSIDSASGGITVADASQLVYLDLAPNYDILAEIELFVSITNVSDSSLNELVRVVVTVEDVPEIPVVAGQNLTILENTEVGSVISTIDITDPDYLGGIISNVTISGDPNGNFAIDLNGNLTLVKPLNFEDQASYSLELTATDDGSPALSGTGIVNITVTNTAPEVADQGYNLDEGQPLAFTLTSLTPDTETYEIVSQPAFGTLSGTLPNLTYTPGPNFLETDSFTYRASDGVFHSAPATIQFALGSVTINSAEGITSGYHVVDAQVSSFHTDVYLKNYDGDNNNIYGTEGYLIFGSGDDVAEGEPFTHSHAAYPSWLSGFSAGSDFDSVTQGYFNSYDSSLLDLYPTIASAISTSSSTAGEWSELVTFNIATSAPKNFRIGVIGTWTAYTSEDSMAPSALRLVFEDGSSAEVQDLELVSYFSKGCVFFDVSIKGSVTGTFSIESQNGSPSSSSSIAGVTIDEITDVIAYPQTIAVGADEATDFELTATAGVTSYTLVELPKYGTLTGVAPTLTYTPASGFRGADNLTFYASQSGVNTDLVTVSFHVDPVSIVSAGPNVGYHLTGTEPKAFRSTDQPKTYDVDDSLADDAYGSTGYYFYGNGSGTANNTDGKPSWVTAVGSGSTQLSAGSAFTDFDDPSLLISAEVQDWTSAAMGYVNIGNSSQEFWAELLTFTIDESAPLKFRVGVMAGHSSATNGRWDPAGLRLSFEGGTPVEVGSLEVTDLGMVFFDVALAEKVSGTFSIEGQKRDLGGNTRGPSIAGVTFDAYSALPTAYDDRIDLSVDQTGTIELKASGEGLIYHLDSLPAHGVLSGDAPNLIYTPPTGFIGSDSFTFHVSDEEHESEIATVEVNVGAVTISLVGSGTGYDIGTVETQGYRSTDVVKTYDPDGDEAYGTDGLFFSVSGGGINQGISSDDGLYHTVNTLPAWISNLDAGADFTQALNRSAENSYDSPYGPIAASVDDHSVESYLMSYLAVLESWREVLTFDILPGSPENFRMGVLASGRVDSWAPGSIRVSFNGAEPVAVDNLVNDGLGMVFFDVSVNAQIGGEISIEIQNGGSGYWTGINGITIDSYENARSAYGEWLLLYGNLPGISPNSIPLAMADTDGDGLSNLLEYVLNMNPTEYTNGTGIELDLNGPGVFQIDRLESSASDTVQVFQYTSDLSADSWVDIPLTGELDARVTLGATVDGMQKVMIDLEDILSAEGKIFGRLSVTLLE